MQTSTIIDRLLSRGGGTSSFWVNRIEDYCNIDPQQVFSRQVSSKGLPIEDWELDIRLDLGDEELPILEYARVTFTVQPAHTCSVISKFFASLRAAFQSLPRVSTSMTSL